MTDKEMQPWQWPEAHWRRIFDPVRARRPLGPQSWPGGARCSVGLRTASWDFSPSTLGIQKELGLLYDSSLMADEDCYELLLDGEPSGVIEMPVEWVRDDAVYFMMNRFQAQRPYTPPTDVFDIFRQEFARAHQEGGLLQLTMHTH